MGAFATTVNSSTSRAVPCRACDHTQSLRVEELLFQRTVFFFFFFLALLRCLHLHLHLEYLVSRSVGLVGVGVKPSLFSLSLASSRVASRCLASPLSLVRDDLVGLVWLVARRSTAQHSVAQHSTAQRSTAHRSPQAGRRRTDGRVYRVCAGLTASTHRNRRLVAWWPGGGHPPRRVYLLAERLR